MTCERRGRGKASGRGVTMEERSNGVHGGRTLAGANAASKKKAARDLDDDL